MKAIATICHNDYRPEDGVRVTLYAADGDDYVWAAAVDGEPYRTDIPLDRIAEAWSLRCWDLQFID